MVLHPPSKTSTARHLLWTIAAVAAAVTVVVILCGGIPPSASGTDARVSGASVIAPPQLPDAAAATPGDAPTGGRERDGSDATGRVTSGVTVFDDEYDAVSRLDPALLAALRTAAADAAADGVAFLVNSGWRSPEYQAQLLREAITEYGSEAEARRWVATPEASQHVSGDAIDLDRDAAGWLSEHGAAYGLCQIYANEPWHFELRPDAAREGCPQMYADPREDPRMQW
jgi:hypothetical protein